MSKIRSKRGRGDKRVSPSLYDEPHTVGDEHAESHGRHVQDALSHDESDREKHVGRREKRQDG